MDTRKEDTDVRTAPEAPAMPAPGEPGPGPSAVPSEPLHGPVDLAEDSLEGLQSAFRALSVEEVDSNPVKRKRERERRMVERAYQTKEQTKGTTRRMILPSRAHQALLASTHHPLLQPPHSQLQTQPLQHPHP